MSPLCVCRNIKQPKNIEKTYQKPFQNEVRTLPKSMPKTCCFSTSFFSGFGLDFDGSWASKLEPSWLKIAIFFMGKPPLNDVKLSVFKKQRLGGLRARFWRPPASIWEGPGPIFEGFGRRKRCLRASSEWQTLRHRLVLHHWAIRSRKVVEILPSHRTSASNACASVSWRRWARCSRSGVAGGVPPRGSSIIGAKLVILASKLQICCPFGPS